jgi:hypothetical protein
LSVNPIFIAIDTTGRLTDAGLKIAEFPVEPIMGKMLLSSKDFKVTFNEMECNWVIMFTHLMYLLQNLLKNLYLRIIENNLNIV